MKDKWFSESEFVYLNKSNLLNINFFKEYKYYVEDSLKITLNEKKKKIKNLQSYV